MDISQSYEEVKDAIEQAVHHHQDKPIEILINNAAIFYARSFHQTKPEEFAEMSKRRKLLLR